MVLTCNNKSCPEKGYWATFGECIQCGEELDYAEFKEPEKIKGVTDIMCLENPWPTIDVLKRLIWASEYLVNEKDYDGLNHEEITLCVKRGKEILELMKKGK